ncbi:MAG TPA: alkaline phosphatase family protein, partial [Gaiella sp.]|nr:alkaline phosphatase family protein [Gaiella sp.]
MPDWRRPEQGRRCFDQLPASVERLLTGATDGPALDEPLLGDRFERVVFVYLDAFGWALFERHAAHPLFARARSQGIVVELTSQFPSTTTAEVTTIHSGLPVAEHGLYEWHLYEPALGRLITPLLFSYAGDGQRGTLAGVLDPDSVFPSESVYTGLTAAGIRSTVLLPAAIAGAIPNIALLRDADVLPYTSTEAAMISAAAALEPAPAYVHVYLDEIDSIMHAVGPEDPLSEAAVRLALDAVAGADFAPGTLILLTSDHGMSPVDPQRTVYVNEVWPEL